MLINYDNILTIINYNNTEHFTILSSSPYYHGNSSKNAFCNTYFINHTIFIVFKMVLKLN